MNKKSLIGASFVCIALYGMALAPSVAAAEQTVNAIYRVSLTDPDSGSVFYTDRQSIRSWPLEDHCKREKDSFSGFHTAAVRGYKLVNATGKALKVKLDSSYCVVR